MNAYSSSLPTIEELWNFSDAKASEDKFRYAAVQANQAGQHAYVLELKTQIARSLGLQRKFSDADAILDEVEKDLPKDVQLVHVRYQLERGRVLNSSNKKTEALPFFINAYNLSIKIKSDNLAIDAAHMVAIAETDSKKQMEWNLLALKVAESSTEVSAQKWLGSLYNNIAWTYHDEGKYNEALLLFKKALAFRETKGEASSIRIAKWSIARAQRSLNQIEEALKTQLQLETEFTQISQPDGYVFEELAELYLIKNNITLAKSYFAKAFDKLSQDAWFVANESKRLNRLKELSTTLQ